MKGIEHEGYRSTGCRTDMKNQLNPARLPISPCIERRKQLYGLCEACNIQLNSEAQAQVHYYCRSHVRRVRQLNQQDGPAPLGPTFTTDCTGGVLAKEDTKVRR